MNKALKPTVGLILILLLMYTGLKILGWGLTDGKVTVDAEKTTSNLKILQPKKKDKEKSSD